MIRSQLASIALTGLLVTLAAPTANAKKIIVPTAPASKAVTPDILDAVSEELERALSKMRIPGAPAPYFIGYKITEVDVNDVVASLGSITDEKERDVVTLEAHVHVGSYKKDNSNFIASGRGSPSARSVTEPGSPLCLACHGSSLQRGHRAVAGQK
jgi:methionine-rich copper-binding protein CopC